MSDVVLIKGKIMFDANDIKDIRGLKYQGESDDYLSDKFIVRIFSRTPFVDLVCDSLPEAQMLYKNIMKSRHIVYLNEMRYGK